MQVVAVLQSEEIRAAETDVSERVITKVPKDPIVFSVLGSRCGGARPLPWQSFQHDVLR
jgi:hypothetical protein